MCGSRRVALFIQVVVLVLDGSEGILRKTELSIASMGEPAICFRTPNGRARRYLTLYLPSVAVFAGNFFPETK